MANDLTDDTTDVTRPAPRTRKPRPRSQAVGWDERLCDPCNLGDHAKCTGVSCYRCSPENHPRHPGISGLSNGLEGGTSPKRAKR